MSFLFPLIFITALFFFLLGFVAYLLIPVTVGLLIWLWYRRAHKQSIKLQLILLAIWVPIAGLTTAGLLLTGRHNDQIVAKEYQNYPYTYFMAGNLPSGYSFSNASSSSSGATITLNKATIVEMPTNDSATYFQPPAICQLMGFSSTYPFVQWAKTNNPCLLLTRSAKGTDIYTSAKAPDYAMTKRANTLILIYQDNIKAHAHQITEIVDNLKPAN
jgi:hypothetical protein